VAEPRDQETRERLLKAGTQLFSERGFAKVTVRDICQRARANVAAINYHFAGKDGLYQQIVQAAIEPMRETTALARRLARASRPRNSCTPTWWSSCSAWWAAGSTRRFTS
jgi:AcrR family transcriptional regulator